MTDIIIAKVTRLTLLQDAHRARKAHRPVAGIMRRLRAVTSLLAAWDGRS